MDISVYTDGSCFKEIESGGWGVYMVQDNKKTLNFSGHSKCRDSITMELLAIAKSFEYIDSFLSHLHPINVVVYTDCSYIVKLAAKKKSMGKTIFPLRDKISKRNKRILFDICNYANIFSSVEWILVKSHSGIKGNEIADRLAKNAAKQFFPKPKK